jgi:N-acetylglucosaminyldiphosphoundecaprenol N-acetyl-beta-D-mannosaminyltransferase
VARSENPVQDDSVGFEGERRRLMATSVEMAKALTSDESASALRSYPLFGIQVCAEAMPDALRRVHEAVCNRRRLHIGVVNAAKIVNMRRDPELHSAVTDSDVIYADGMSVVWAGRFLNAPLPERIAGIDLMTGILKQGNESGYRVFCLGASDEVLSKVCDTFAQRYPGVTIAGRHHGYFDETEEKGVAQRIKAAKADVLFVAITSPKKERFMARWADVINVPVVHGVGGSFDVVAGIVERAPETWQRLGLEWLYRVKQEPRRLWKRYLVTNAVFLTLLIAEKAKTLYRTR